MRKHIITILATLALLSLPSALWSNATQAGGVFLTIFPGAKATAMGAAFSAIADDATASYYNPGALAFFRDHMEFAMIHAPWLRKLSNDMYYEFSGFVYPLKNSRATIGGHIIYLTLGQVDAYGDGSVYVGSFRPFDFALDVAFGYKVKENLGVGLSTKFIYSFLAPGNIIREVIHEPGQGGSAMSFAVDAGVLYRPRIPVGNLGLAAVLTNIGPGLKYTESGQTDPLPRTLRLGMAYTVKPKDYLSVTLSADVNKVLVGIQRDLMEKGVRYVLWEAFDHVGLETGLMDIVFVRIGYFMDREGKRIGLTYGGGVKFKSFKLDIADDSKIYSFEESSNLRYALSYVKYF